MNNNKIDAAMFAEPPQPHGKPVELEKQECGVMATD